MMVQKDDVGREFGRFPVEPMTVVNNCPIALCRLRGGVTSLRPRSFIAPRRITEDTTGGAVEAPGRWGREQDSLSTLSRAQRARQLRRLCP